MSNNIELDEGAGGSTVRTIQRNNPGPHTPVSLLDVGGTAAESLIGDSGVTLPVGGLVDHDAVVSGKPVLQALEAKDFDSAALPNVVSAEGDVVRAAGSLYGVQYVMPVNEDGSAVATVTIQDGGGVISVDDGAGSLTVDQPTAANFNCTEASAASIKTAVEIMDDWDESDRAKVNLIVGQAGVAAGAGAVGTSTQRMTLASDDPAVTALQIVDDWDETDRAKVNLIVSQAGITGGAGAVAANTPRVTLASDDPAVTALQLIDDTVGTVASSAGSKVLLVGGQDSGGNARAATVNTSGYWTVQVFSMPSVAITGMADHDATYSDNPIQIGAYASATAPTDVSSDGDAVRLWALRNGSLVTNLAAGGTLITATSTSLNANVTNATLAVTQSGTWTEANSAAIKTAVELIDNAISGSEMQVDVVAALPAGTNNIGDVDVLSVIPGTGATNLGKAIDTATGATDTGVLLLATRDDALSALTPIEGDNVQLRTDANGALWAVISGTVTVASHAVTNAGTFAVQESGGALTALQIMDDWDNAASDGASVSGDVAHDTTDGGEPVKVGMKAIAHGTNPTAVAADDRTNWYANRHGVPWVIGGHPNVITRTVRIADADGAQTDASIAGAIGAGTKVVVTSLMVTADNDNTDDIRVKVGFGATTLPADSTSGANGILCDHPGVPAGGGFTRGDGGGILGVGGDGEELRLTCDDPVGGAVTITFSYYTIES